MEVLDILKKNGAELYPEDLAFFEAELDTGEYAVEYIDACKKLISEIRAWKKQKTAKPGNESGMSGNVFVSKEKLTPGSGSQTPDGKRTAGADHPRHCADSNGFKLQNLL